MTVSPLQPVRTVRLALLACYVTTASVGSTLIVRHWLSHGEPRQAVVRTALYALLLCVLHLCGERLYFKQPARWSPLYVPQLKFALFWHVVTLLFASIILDGGFIFRCCCGASVGFWIAVALVATRRPESPTERYLLFIRHGYPAIAFASAFLAINIIAL